MSLELNEMRDLARRIMAAKDAPNASYSFQGQALSYEAMNETLRREFAELASDYYAFEDNKNKIFRLVGAVIDEVLPKKIEERYDAFAETVTLAQGDKFVFKRPLGMRARAKQFITRVGLNGRYEVFKINPNENESFEVRTSAIGGAAQIGFEEFLDGRVDFAELTQIVMDGMDELIYKEVAASLKASVGQLPIVNRVVGAGFDEAAMDKLIMIASAYGAPTIYCTYEFAVKMIPQDAWRYTEAMKDELWRTGRLANYKSTPVVILEQGFEDETNSRKVLDPGYCWIIPSGADSKPVKIVLEGATIVHEFENRDLSRELQVYKKVGVGTILANNICAYVDTSLAGKMNTWDINGVTGKVYNYAGELSK